MAALTVADLLVVLSGDSRGFEGATKRVNKNLMVMGKKMQSFGQSMTMKMSLPLAAIGIAAAKMAMDFDSAMNRMVSLVGLARSQVDGWRTDILKIGRATGQMAGELAEAMFFITSAGARGRVALEILEASAKAAAVGLGKTKSVAFAAVSAVNAFGEANLSADKAVATLVATVREGNLEAESIAPTLGRVMGIASNLGVKFHEVGAAYAAMTRLGTSAEESATSLRSTLVSILKPTKQSRDAMEQMGMSFGEIKTQLREKGLLSVLFRLRDAFQANEKGMAAVFPNIRALSGVLNMVGSNAASTQKIFDSLAKTTEKDLTKAFAAAEISAKHQFNIALADMNVALVKLGQEILPALIPMVQTIAGAIGKTADAFEKLSPGVRMVALGLGGTLIILPPMITLFAIMAQKILWVISSMQGLAAAQVQVAATGNTVLAYQARFAAAQARQAKVMMANKLAVAGLGFAIGYLIGSAIRPWIESLTGLDKALFKVANQAKDLADATTDQSFSEELAQYDKMRKLVGKLGEEYRISSDATRENKKRLAELLPEIQRAVHVYNEELRTKKGISEEDRKGREAAQKMIEAWNAKKAVVDDYVTTLKEEHGLQTKQDILNSLKEQIKAYKVAKKLGISKEQLEEAFGEDLVKNLEIVKQYKIPMSQLPDGLKEMATAIGEKAQPALQELLMDLGQFGTQYESLVPKVTGAMTTMTDAMTGEVKKLKDSLSGGFGIAESLDEELTYGKQALMAFVEEQSGRQVPVEIVVDDAKFMQWMDDLVNGRLAPGGGRTS